jgi:hypothetical protein
LCHEHVEKSGSVERKNKKQERQCRQLRFIRHIC